MKLMMHSDCRMTSTMIINKIKLTIYELGTEPRELEWPKRGNENA